MEGTNNSTTATHVAVLTFPFGTHAAPLLTIIRRLASAAPDTLFSFFNSSKSNKTLTSNGKHDNLPHNLKFCDVFDGVPQDYEFVGKHQEDIELFIKAAPENFRSGIKAAVDETGIEVSCMVTDSFLWFGADMAKEMGVPWVSFWTAGSASLSTHVHTDLIRKTIGLEGFVGLEDQRLTFIPGLSKILLRDLPEGILFGNLESVFSCMLHQMGLMLPQAAAVLINSFQQLDPIITDDLRRKFNKFLSIGPFNFVPSSSPEPRLDSSGCIAWLDKQKIESVVYISFGSVTVPPPKELLAIAEALETSGVPFVWSLRDSSRVHLPDGFIGRTKAQGMVVPWAPQVDVLGHSATGVFITHCGWNSLLETMAGQVPMICRPFFGDQRLNARMVEDVWEIGLRVDGVVFTKMGTMKCMDLILNQELGKKMREKVKALKQLAEFAVGPDGSSTKNIKELLDIVKRPKGVSSV